VSAVHVAIIDTGMVPGLLDGRKRVESRFARQRRLPYGCVSPGDQIHFKVSGANIIGHAPVTGVREFDDLTPAAVESLRRQYNCAILAPRTYWQARRHCRYGVLIWLGRLTSCTPPLVVPRQYGNGWMVLSGREP
jgi:ASC-1-like (ASCH) protein